MGEEALMLGDRLRKANEIAKKRFAKWNGYSIYKIPDYERRFYNGETLGAILGSYRKSNVRCSNPFCCGNERHIRGRSNRTIDETKSDIDFMEQINEVF